ncbi:MAG: carboxypeptidase-like regulatory domain-containing protein [Candidatus Margulisiibacteriota bacterium]
MANLIKLVVCLLFFTLSGCGDMEGTVTSITINPPTITVGINQTQYFSAVAKDNNGQIISVTPTWSVTGGIGSISSGGILTATTTDCSGTVVATVNSVSGSSLVTITSKGWVEGRVTDELGIRVNGMKISIKSLALVAFTDSNGDYSIANVPQGHYEIWSDESSTLYHPASVEATVNMGERSKFHNFTLIYFSKPPDTTSPDPSTLLGVTRQ